MATVTPTVTRDVGERDGTAVQWTWTLTSANPDGAPLEWTEWADRTFTATGTWGAATLSIQGTNDTPANIAAGSATWFTLSNAAGATAATATADKIMAIIETPRYIRPNLTVVGAGATITVALLGRRHSPVRT